MRSGYIPSVYIRIYTNHGDSDTADQIGINRIAHQKCGDNSNQRKVKTLILIQYSRALFGSDQGFAETFSEKLARVHIWSSVWCAKDN